MTVSPAAKVRCTIQCTVSADKDQNTEAASQSVTKTNYDFEQVALQLQSSLWRIPTAAVS